MQTIYIADDERNIRELIALFLKKEGFRVEAFENGDLLLEACDKKLPDLIVLDIMMSGTDGLSVCSRLRERDEMLPIIIVSAKDTPHDRITGLNLGSDDYLVKPFMPLELVARVNALLRRSNTKNRLSYDKLSFGDLSIDKDSHSVEIGSRPLPLTPTEYSFLVYLLENKDRAISREELLKELWNMSSDIETRATDDLVKRLRHKLKALGSDIRIVTVWGYGFRLSRKDYEV